MTGSHGRQDRGGAKLVPSDRQRLHRQLQIPTIRQFRTSINRSSRLPPKVNFSIYQREVKFMLAVSTLNRKSFSSTPSHNEISLDRSEMIEIPRNSLH
jgi:hypothetical protein